MTTIAELATELKTTQKIIINELDKTNPEGNWKGTTNLSDELVAKIKQGKEAFMQTATPQMGGKLTTKEAKEINQRAISFAILEALSDQQLPLMQYSGQVQAALEIQAFEGGKSQVWGEYCKAQGALQKGQIARAQQQAAAFLPAANQALALQSGLNQLSIEIQDQMSELPALF